MADNFLLDAVRGDPVLAQDGARGLIGGGNGEQEMFAADVPVPEPASVVLGLHDDAASFRCEELEHHCPPTRRPYFRWTVCLVTPSRSAMSCQDHPRFRADSTWRISSRSVS